MSDYARQRIVDRLLAHLEANGSDEHLRELAAGVRRGDAPVRDFVANSSYAEALQPGLENFAGWYDTLSDSDRAEQAEQCRQVIEKIDEQAAANDAGPI
ncbi:hypothetical protein [Actinoplanes solisilvae]|uniref:hypothetical protein n=1 Tax=Actinoplanes solisilvae TaxID=2486853 RepID=UPI000FD98227|nr:hypothetical protein [Actinoplanes solisilvae]